MKHVECGLVVFLILAPPPTQGQFLGHEKTPYPPPTYADVLAVKRGAVNATGSHRQDICQRYRSVLNGTVRLRDALQGLQLRPNIYVDHFFHYDDRTGIDPIDPGIVATLLDELGKRAGFTWRNSFGVFRDIPQPSSDAEDQGSLTFSDMLLWSSQTYDMSCSWWSVTLERMEMGIAFQQPWFDGSYAMIQREPNDEIDSDTIDVWNWLRPFTPAVWYLTLGTIFFSGLSYQWLEHLSGHRKNRSWFQWFGDNLYLSAIAFPQNYEFEPRSMGGRIFGVSMSLWALLMTATYTANLASLLVDTKVPTLVVQDFHDVVMADLPVCVVANSGIDTYVKKTYPQAIQIQFPSELEAFEALHNGTCAIAVTYYQNWLAFASQKAFNPSCDMKFVGRTLKSFRGGFANLADSGMKCTSLIGHVLDIHFNELEETAYLEEMWMQYNEKKADMDCAADLGVDPGGNPGRRRQLAAGKGGGIGVAAVIETEGTATQMTPNQMAGIFILHFWLTGLAVLIGYISMFHKKLRESKSNMNCCATNAYDLNVGGSLRQEQGLGNGISPRKGRRRLEDEEPCEDAPVTQSELRQTKEELQQTQKEIKDQMDLMLKLLIDIRQDSEIILEEKDKEQDGSLWTATGF